MFFRCGGSLSAGQALTFHSAKAISGNAHLGGTARAVDQAAGSHDLGTGLLDGGDAFARRHAG
jgi:hypothetical protein